MSEPGLQRVDTKPDVGISVDELLDAMGVTSCLTEDGAGCGSIAPECSRQAVYVVWWRGDPRLTDDLRCGCNRSSLMCLPCFERQAAVGVSKNGVIECAKCSRFMTIRSSQPYERGTA